MTYDPQVPEIEIRSDGTALPPAIRSRLRSAEVDLALNRAGRFRLTFSDPGFRLFDQDLLDFGGKLDVRLGYRGSLRSVMVGKVVVRDADLRRTGAPECTIGGADSLLLLARRVCARTFLDSKSSDVIARIVSDHGISARCDDSGLREPYRFQSNVSDLEFVLDLAREAGFDLWMEGETLHAARPDYGRTPALTLAWGRDLLAFRPRFSTASATAKVEVRGWDPKAKKTIGVVVEGDPDRAAGTSVVDLSGDLARVRTVSAGVTSEAEAERLGRALLARGAADGLKALCETHGRPEILPGAVVKLEGVGRRLSGLYRVVSAKHRLGARGYLTLFEVRRNAFTEPEPPPEAEAAPPPAEETVDIEAEVVDALGEPVREASYTITLATGARREGMTDAEGKIFEASCPKGSYTILLQDGELTVVGRA